MASLPSAVLFDHDGVLVASEPLHGEAWGLLIKQLGLPDSDAEVQALVGKTAPEIMAALLNKHRPGWDKAEYDVHALALRKNDFYLGLTQTKLRAYPGVVEGLEWLRSKGIKTAVVSNAKRRELDAALKYLKLAPLLDVIVSRDEYKIPKPDPTGYLYAAACLEVEPANCFAVEDSPPGLEAALMARVPGVAVLTNFSRAVMEQPVPGRPDLRPMWVVESIAEFFERLRAIAG